MSSSHKPIPVPQIRSADQARLLWKAFHAKYEHLKQPAPEKAELKAQPMRSFAAVAVQAMSKAKKIPIKTAPVKSKLTKDEAAKKIQQFWTEARKSDRLIPARLGKRHTPMLHYV